MTTRKDTCATCRFYLHRGEPFTHGECRRHAPISVEENWPATKQTDWCGDHEPKDTP